MLWHVPVPREKKQKVSVHAQQAHEASGYLCGRRPIRPIEHQIIIAAKVARSRRPRPRRRRCCCCFLLIPSVLLHIINDGQIGRASTVLHVCGVSRNRDPINGDAVAACQRRNLEYDSDRKLDKNQILTVATQSPPVLLLAAERTTSHLYIHAYVSYNNPSLSDVVLYISNTLHQPPCRRKEARRGHVFQISKVPCV